MIKYYLGVDIGSKTLGLATSRGIITTGYGVYFFLENNFFEAVKYLSELIKKEKFSDIVIGFPKNMNNTIGISALIVRNFITLLKPLLNSFVKIHLLDERLTTHQVNQIMLENNFSRKKRKQKKDILSAQLILETYLKQK